jgi:mitochondrial chaperone BCS1
MLEFLQDNQIATGGIVVLLSSSVLWLFRSIPGYLYSVAERNLVYSVEVSSYDESFQWMSLFLSKKLNSNVVSAVTSVTGNEIYAHITDKEGYIQKAENEKNIITNYSPAIGYHFFWYQHRLVIIYKSRQEQNMLSYGQIPIERYTFLMLLGNKPVFDRLLLSARDMVYKDRTNMLGIYVSDRGWEDEPASWKLSQRTKKRFSNSIFLPNNTYPKLLQDIRKFYASREWYEQYDIPYHRCYLFHGPPGSGKTTLAKVIASEIDVNLGIVSLTDPAVNDKSLPALLRKAASNKILVVMEDLDRMLSDRQMLSSKDNKLNSISSSVGLTTSGLLNSLDGLVSPEGFVIIMTTNDISNVDDVLLRPGRVDYRLEFHKPTIKQIQEMHQKYLPYTPVNEINEFAKSMVNEPNVSMAMVQDILIDKAKKIPDAQVKNA